METVLIVGAGEVGARVARAFAARTFAPDRIPTQVTAWTRSTASARVLAAQGLARAAAVDIAATESGRERLPVDPAGYDQVYLCAAPGGGLSQDARAVYVDGYARVLKALESCARLPRRVVLAGSTGVIGDQGGAAVDESVARDDQSVRGKILCACEDQLRQFAERHAAAGVSAVLLRMVGLYGPGRSPLAALRAGRYRYPGDPAKTVNLLHLSDAAAALVAAGALALPGGATEIIHCSDGQFPTRREYIAAICRRFDLALPAEAGDGEALAGAPGTAGAGKSNARVVGDRRIGNEKMRRLLLPELAFPSYREGIESLELPPGAGEELGEG